VDKRCSCKAHPCLCNRSSSRPSRCSPSGLGGSWNKQTDPFPTLQRNGNSYIMSRAGPPCKKPSYVFLALEAALVTIVLEYILGIREISEAISSELPWIMQRESTHGNRMPNSRVVMIACCIVLGICCHGILASYRGSNSFVVLNG
jgi:hypothetical protein